MIRERRRTEEGDLESDGAIRWISINGEKNAATLNLVKGDNIYGEKLVKYEGEEYRIWDPLEASLLLHSKRE
jgi:fibrillarin-like rRNA methylase